jgi:hypothetical protein
MERGVTIVVSNLGFVHIADIRFDDVPDTGPESQIAQAICLDSTTALEVLKEACGPQGKLIGMNRPPKASLRVIDERGLKSLDPAKFDTFKIEKGYEVAT